MISKKSSSINNIIKEYSDKSNDFGFTTVADSDIFQEKQNEECKEKLKKVEELIMPLLTNLMKNPETEIIKWPNRGPIIEQKIKELLNITRG